MFVAIFEAMFRVRVRGIVRVPKYTKDYKENAQLIDNALTTAFRVDISHLNGSLICEGDITAISELVNIFSDIIWGRIQKRRTRSRSASLTRNKRSGAGSATKKGKPTVKKSGVRGAPAATKKKGGVARSKSASAVVRKRPVSRKRLRKKATGAKKSKVTKTSRTRNSRKPKPRPPVPSSKVLKKKKKKKKVSKAKSGNNNSAAKSADVLIEGGESSAPETAKGSGANDNGQDQEIDPTVESPETNEDAPEENIQDDDDGKGVDTRLENDERVGSPELNSLISSVDEVKAGQPLWDLLWKTRATAETKASISPRRAKREESQKRHRMYKKLLKEQLRAVEKQVATRKEAEGSRSRAEAHKKRVETIQQQRLHQDLRRAALARMARRRRRKNAPLTACSKLP